MKSPILCFCCLLVSLITTAQNPTNILLTNPTAADILDGNYDPAEYASDNPIIHADDIICLMQDDISTDSLYQYLLKLGSFHNRNTIADTTSPTTGIGATRRWIHSKFEDFSAQRENRLIPSYLQFDDNVTQCGFTGQFRNILAVLPGASLEDPGIILIEGHVDSRCEDPCDINCKAHGSEDNGSGTVLVMELARVMSRFTFSNTLVFMATIGEEQGLYGANAFAQYCVDQNITIKAVQNNDVVGGIICGGTSSPPSCPAENHIDSTQVRIFSLYQATATQHRSYARFVKTIYEERLAPIAAVPMTISIINQEDRSGRGGDHMPFSDRGMTAIRFTAANEHGNANPGLPTYDDRQHTVNDTLGVDTDSDGVVDSFFVDFNYLKRNALINATASAMAALAPETPDFELVNDNDGLTVRITSHREYMHFRVGVRRNPPTDFEALYEMNDTVFTIPNLEAQTTYYISVAGIDDQGYMSLYSTEKNVVTAVATASDNITPVAGKTDCSKVGIEYPEHRNGSSVYLFPPYPNPFAASTRITVHRGKQVKAAELQLVITDISGKTIQQHTLDPSSTRSHMIFRAGQHADGIYFCTLYRDGRVQQTRKLILMR